ncbi:MAG TPA: hypothetical protein VFQ72_01505 [Candidatus Paceibacterota bacterium]|nr:hypothetical protein [Candidatus Paceibacterota bacterium]
MKEKGNLKNLLTVGGILIAVAVAAYFYFTRDQSGDELLSSTDAGSVPAPIDGTLLAALQQLRKIHLDDSIFQRLNPALQSGQIRDFGQTLQSEEPYRQNPFAPLSAGAGSASTSTSPAR